MENEPKVINMRGIDCQPEVEGKFNKWYNEIHIPLIMKTGEIEEVTRYKRITDDDKYPKYLAVYKLEDREAFARYQASPQMLVVREEMKESWPEGGFESKWAVQYEPIKTWKK